MRSATELDDMGVECISIKQAIIDVNIGCACENFACLGIVLMGCLLAWGNVHGVLLSNEYRKVQT